MCDFLTEGELSHLIKVQKDGQKSQWKVLNNRQLKCTKNKLKQDIFENEM